MRTSSLTLLALAVGSLYTSAATAAETPKPVISFYGQAHVSADYLDDDSDGALNISSNTSRFGIRASYEVEPGLTVLAQVESLVRLDEGDTDLGSRDSFVGLQGDFGLVRVGYMDSLTKQIRTKVDLFGNKIGDARNIVRGGGVDVDKRLRNSVHYKSPAYNNFTFDVHYSSNDKKGETTTDNKNDVINTAVTYDDKKLYVSLAYEKQSQIDTDDTGGIRLGASYVISPNWQVTALVQRTSDFTTPLTAGSGDNITRLETPYGDRTAWGLGVRYSLDKYSLSAQYYSAGDADHLENSGADMLALGIDRKFGKNLSVYAAYALTRNDDNTRYFNVSGGGGHGKAISLNQTDTGVDLQALSIGAIYNF